MSKQTFDFSEALRRMKQGKKVRRIEWKEKERVWLDIEEKEICYISYLGREVYHFRSYDNFFSLEDILATDWEEVVKG